MWPFSSRPTVPVLRLTGPIGMATPLRPGLSLAAAAPALEKAFTYSKLPAVVVSINSPGGSPVQSSLLFKRMRQLAVEHKKKIYVFCEDVAASGGYYLAVAGDEIYADASSIVGSIGVIASGFGFVEAIEKLGIERRVYTAGKNKSILDPFKPEKPDDIARLNELQLDVHEVFKNVVKERRGEKLATDNDDLFSGAFWSAHKAEELGLIDGITDMRTKMRELYGEKVALRPIKLSSGGFLSRLLRAPSTDSHHHPVAMLEDPRQFADHAVSAVEARLLWSRFGL